MSAREGPPIFPFPVSSSSKYRCSACDAVFKSETDLRNHVKIAHPEEMEPETAEKLVIMDLGYKPEEKTKPPAAKIPKMNLDEVSRILKSVSPPESFLFFTDLGQYTGQYASSLAEFAQKMNVVSLKSVEFHHTRGDFSKWIKDIFSDEYLANKLRQIEKSLKGVELRNTIRKIVEEHLNELEKES